ncbi:CASP C terminal-domain-containing protein [Myxozyma melibiosi]|uniref:Protein CASP n=1 Tax=Myxozyma melibiosi TaxID=54550 RepID=A0ABR1F5B3_9ASCO
MAENEADPVEDAASAPKAPPATPSSPAPFRSSPPATPEPAPVANSAAAQESKLAASTKPKGSALTSSTLTLEERKTPFEQALKAWSDINLTELQKQLDSQGLEIVENQKVSVVGRKELASKTKEFRKLPDDAKLTEIKSLLKAYQLEIDNLTKRGKAAENAFLNTYRVLAEAPDPYPLLEATLDSLMAGDEAAALSTENARLKSQLARYADYDELKAKIAETEQKVIDVSAQKVSAKEAELRALLDEKERNWKLREEDLTRQAQEAREQVREMRATHAVTEARLVQHEQKLDEGVAGRFAEAELIAADLERVNLRALQTERRNLELRQELEKLKSTMGQGGGSEEERAEWKQKIDDLRSENAALGRKIDALREEAKTASDMEARTRRMLERDNARKTEEVEGLRKRLKSMADYDDIKRELDILKYVEFSAEAEDDGDQWATESKPDAHEESLEQLLLSRNKKLNAELTTLRVAHNDATKRLAAVEADLSSTKTSLEQSQHLNRKLEEDLTSLHESTTGLNSGAIIVPGGADDDVRSQVGGSGAITPGGRSLDQHVADLTILPIITQQRDRFRARNAELEQELRSEYSRISELRSQIERLQKDNVALYEKTRYLSTYRSNSAAQVNAGIDESSSYGRDYAEHISPFAQFRGREQERALSRMGPLERVIYGLTRVVLANKTSRNMFFSYLAGLHLFLMGTIWYLALGEVGKHDNITDAPPSRAGEVESGKSMVLSEPVEAAIVGQDSPVQQQEAVAGAIVAAVQATAAAAATATAQVAQAVATVVSGGGAAGEFGAADPEGETTPTMP